MSKKIITICILMSLVFAFGQGQAVKAKSKMNAPKIISYKEEFGKNWDKSNFTVKWDKVKNAVGYQVCCHSYEPGGDPTSPWSLTKDNTKKTIYKFEWPDLAEKFKIRVRAWKIVNGKKIYGAWSSKVNIKVQAKKGPFSRVTKVGK